SFVLVLGEIGGRKPGARLRVEQALQQRGNGRCGRSWLRRRWTERLERSTQAAGVLRPVLRIEPSQHIAGALVDEVDGAQVPLGVAHLDTGEMAIAVRQLEASAVDDDAAVALLLRPRDAAGEGEAERDAARTGPRHRRPFEK